MPRPGFSFCICPDAGLIKGQIESLMQEYPPEASSGGLMGGSTNATWERHVYWGDDDLSQNFWNHLTIQGLFNTPIALIVRNAQNLPAATWKSLSSALATSSSTKWPIFCLEVPFDKKQAKIPAHITKLKCFSVAEQNGWAWRNGGLDAQGVKRFVQERAKQCGLNFEPNVLEALCASTPPDATAIENEIQKLALAAPQGKVSMDMINVGAYLPESNIFAFISCVQAGNIAAAWREIYRGQKDVAALFFPFLALLAREARTLWQMLAKEPVHVHFSVAQSKEQCARKLGFAGVAKIFALIVQAEQQVKSGHCDAEQALESVVVDLARLFRTGH